MSCHCADVRVGRRGFTLVELLASMAILSLILLVMFGIIQQTGQAWKGTRSRIESFQGSRRAFESLTSTLSQSTLNTYYDYFDAAGRSPRDAGFAGADHYGRQSDLHFMAGKSLIPSQITHATFFQTPAGYDSEAKYQGMDTLLNACGFYVAHGQDTLRPKFLTDGTVPNAPANEVRYRLMQFFQPSQDLGVYSFTDGREWFTRPLAGDEPPVRQLAENVIALAILPRESEAEAGAGLAPDYEYDSRASSKAATQSRTENQLPPLVEVVLVSIDESSAKRLGEKHLSILDELFQKSAELDADLARLETELRQQRLTYRVFRTVVPLRNSKWNS